MTRDDEPRLDVTLAQLQRMYSALAALREERDVYGEALYAAMAEGPLEMISRLERTLAELTGRAELERAQAALWLRIEGEGAAWPQASTSVLTHFLDALRKGVQLVAEQLATDQIAARPTQALIQACDLEIVALAPGSLRVGLRLPGADTSSEPGSVPGAARQALETYLRAAAWVGSEQSPEELPAALEDVRLRRLVLTQLKRILPRPRGRVQLVELSGALVPAGGTIQLQRAAHARIDAVFDEQEQEHHERYEGDIREIDLDALSFVLRNVTGQSDMFQVGCAFEDELSETALQALNRRVEVTGVRAASAHRRGSPRLRVHRIVILEP